MKQTYTNNRKTMSFFKDFWIRLCAVVAMLTVQGGAVYATGVLKVNGVDATSVCPTYSVELRASNFTSSPDAVIFYESSDSGNSWTQVRAVVDKSGTFVTAVQIGTTAKTFKAVTTNGDKEETNFVTVEVSADCEDACYQSVSGEFINGTDFNIVNGDTTKSESIKASEACDRTQVHSKFHESDITMICQGTGTISNDFSKYMGGLTPNGNYGFTNYYWFLSTDENKNGDMVNTPFEFEFTIHEKKDGAVCKESTKREHKDREAVWDGKNYRISQLVYISKRDGCNSCDDNSLIKMATGSGSDGNFYENADNLEFAFIYDDNGDTLVSKYGKKKGHAQKSFSETKIGEWLCNIESGRLVRLHLNFYGKFDFRNEDYTFKMQTGFQQWGKCFNVAIDYISADEMSVCYDKSPACLGSTVLVNAAGFPYNSNYIWEYKNGNTWERLKIGGVVWSGKDKKTAKIKVEDIGKVEYRVYDSTTVDKYSEYIYFEINGLNCDPVTPSRIAGEGDTICAPMDSKFWVDPLDPNENVRYSWALYYVKGKDAQGNDIDSLVRDNLHYTISDTIRYNDKDWVFKGDSVLVKFDEEDKVGDYKLVVQTMQRKQQSSGEYEWDAYGDSVPLYLKVHQTPDVELKLITGDPEGTAENDKVLCPSDKNQIIIANATVHSQGTEFVYEWENASGLVGHPDSARVALPNEESCAGELKSYKIGVTVSVKDFGCPSYVSAEYDVAPLREPEIICEDLADTLLYKLGATDSTFNVVLPKVPSFNSDSVCEKNPAYVVTISKAGEEVKKYTTSFNTALEDFGEDPAVLPEGEYKVEFVLVNGCGVASNPCNQVLVVKDVTAPNIDCSEIDPLETSLSKIQPEGSDEKLCEAPTGGVSLPTITAPILTDRNGVDGDIKGEYLGRYENPSQAIGDLSLESVRNNFKTDVNENAPYVVGETYILWGFSDGSNVAYCTQLVKVIDDLKPEIVCPEVPSEFYVPSEDSVCGLSVTGLIRIVGEPNAMDPCSGENSNVPGKVYYAKVKDSGSLSDSDYEYVPPAKYDSIIFYIDQKYTIRWRFAKLQNAGVYADCEFEFVVKDSTAPDFDCQSLRPVNVYGNTYKVLHQLPEYLDYASYGDVTIGDKVYKGTLKDAFDNDTIELITSKDIVDNCSGNDVDVFLNVIDPDGNIIADQTTIKSTDDLKKLEYKIGLTTLAYRFVDRSGNERTCNQLIYVRTSEQPEPSCLKEQEITLEVGDDCNVLYELKPEDVPTATFPVMRIGYYFEFPTSSWPSSKWTSCSEVSSFPEVIETLGMIPPFTRYQDYDDKKPMDPKNFFKQDAFTVDYLCQITDEEYFGLWSGAKAFRQEIRPKPTRPGFPPAGNDTVYHEYTVAGESSGFGPAPQVPATLNNWKSWGINVDGGNGRILTLSGSLTNSTDYIGYPFEIEFLQIEDDKETSLGVYQNEYTENDTAATRVVIPRVAYGGTKCFDHQYACAYKKVKKDLNFDLTDGKIFSKTLSKGKYRLVYRYEDTEGGKSLDSCSVIINVVDKSAPKLDCDTFLNPFVFAARAQCVVPAEVVGLKKLTPSDFKAYDNCEDVSKLNISYERRPEGSNIQNTSGDKFFNSFPYGESTITWSITDASGNVATCVQTIHVVDSTAPNVVCDYDTLKAYTDASSCEVNAEAVIKAGLSVPQINEIDCSAGVDDEVIVKGVGSRYRRNPETGKLELENKDLWTDPYKIDTTFIKWVFTDKAGNSDSCWQPIVVVDTIPPVFANCDDLKDLKYNLEADECEASISEIENLFDELIAEDNCSEPITGVPYLVDKNGVKNYSNLPAYSPLPSSFAPKKDGYYEIMWLFVDDRNNAQGCFQKLFVRDTISPDISDVCPDDKLINVDATTDCSVGISDLNLKSIEEMKVNDVCDGIIYPELIVRLVDKYGKYFSYRKNNETGQDEIKDLTFPVTKPELPHYVAYVYTDAAGNSDSCIFEVQVADRVPLVMTECQEGTLTNITTDEGCEASIDLAIKAISIPKVVDPCVVGSDNTVSITPVVYRYTVSCKEQDADKNCLVYDTTMVATSLDGGATWDNTENLPLGVTLFKWVFEDAAGNADSCLNGVNVIHDYAPNPDCSTIDTLRPVAKEGECEIVFGSIKDMLADLKYYAVDACTNNSILGVLTHFSGEMLEDDYVMKVGDTLTFLWTFTDEFGNSASCEQIMIPNHQIPLNPACKTAPLEDFEIVAKEGECEAEDGAAASIPVPTANDPCTNDVIKGVPFIFEEVDGVKDTLSVDFATKVFPTGTTTIHWQFVSPFNLKDTAWCEQNVVVKGNKKFDLDCETLTPMRRDTIDDCGVTDPTEFVIDTPMVNDPCVKDENGEPVVISGVPVRSDKKEMSEGFSIGETEIMWIFTDVTGAINDTCVQTIEVRTSLDMIIECDSIDSVVVAVEEGQCTVEASQVELPTPFALHPCLLDENRDSIKIWGVPTRSDRKPLDAPYYVGKTTITWTFTDTTETLVNEVRTCTSEVIIGDVNQLPLDCNNFPGLDVVLPEGDCELSWATFGFEVKPVVDLCSKQIINPTVTIKSTGKVIEYKTYFVKEDSSKVETLPDGVLAIDTVVELLSNDIKFGLGDDIIVWDYSFGFCEQRISVKNQVAPSGGCENVPDELTFQAPTGECEMASSMVMDSLLAKLNPWPVAYDHCDVNKKNPIKGRVYYNGEEITVESKFEMPVGKNTVTWVFIDPAINTVGDTCEKTIIIQSDLAPEFDCESLDTLNFETDDCEYTYEWNDENTPAAKDACTGEEVKGVGTRSDGKDLNASYPVGETVITWEFVSPYSTAVHSCTQSVWVRTTAQPLFDCESLDTIKLTTPEGVCEVDAFGYLNEMTKPVAEDSCTGIKIEGVPLTKDSVAFAETDKFVVGDTTKIIWKFFNESLNVNAKYCDQYVLVTGSNKPLFNCDTLKAHDTKFEIAGCDTILGSDALPVPVALDSCTKDSVWGVGTRSDGKELSDPFPVGTTIITWTFKSPYSNVPATCDQEVVVLTTQEIDFDCEALDTIVIPVADIDICDVMGVVLDGQFAEHPCPEQSGITRIVGVPFVNNATVITPNADSTKWTIEKVHVGKHTITWTFTDPSDPATMQNPTKTCKQVLQVGEGTNASVDCENFPDTTFRLSPDDCAITWSEMALNIAPVKDLCADTLLIPVVSRSSGKAISAVLSPDSTKMIITADDFTVGVDTIKWEFESIGAECKQVIIVKDSTAPQFDCENFEPEHLTLSAPTGTCEIVASEVYDSLAAMFEPWPFAIEYCTKEEIPGRVFIDDANNPDNEIKKGSSLNISVGDHKLVWVFIDTLINEIGDTCVKDFTLMSDLAPVFECSDLTDITFKIEGCNTTELTDADIPTPVATDACVEDKEIPAAGVRLNPDGTVQVGANGDTLSVLGVYPVGTTVIRWTFVSPFSKIEKVCYQKIVVLSEQKLDFDCEILSKETIRIPLDPTTELSNPEAATSKLDTLHANHPCPVESGVEFVMGVPSIEGKDKFILSADSLKWTIPALPADTYTIVWTFTDTTGTLVEPIKVCTQNLIVEDVIDTLTCPPGRNMTTVACESELPDTFKTFEEFIGAGGSITDHNDFDKSSFGYKEFSEGQKYCDEMRRIMYYVLDVRKDTVACIDTFFIKDTIAPAFVGDLKPMTVTCDQDVPELLKPAVDDCDPDVVITSERTSTQGDDPNKCDYYSYVVTYKWIAKDRCGNVNDTTQIINVVDTIAPKVTLPSNWADTVLSIYEKGCVFRVPDFTEDLRDENVISDNCSPIGSVIITQTPQGGDTIYQTTKILITISDPCGSDTVVEKWVYAPTRESVIELTSTDTTSCVSDDSPISLMDLSLRYAVGSYKEFDDWAGEYYEKPSSFQWDVYRGKVHKDSLVYSNNKYTYAGEFKHLTSDEAEKLYHLTRQKGSGTYWFVAADTTTMCTDTSSSVITLKERPRVSVTTGVEEVCENTLMDSATIYSYFDCVADMGAPIIKEGWMYGDSLYNFEKGKFALIENSASFIYYAENECGSSTSMDSYKYFCGLDSLTKEDSIFFVGADNYPALKEDKLVVDGHVTINVHQRFDPSGITITTEPHDPARIWLGELVELQAHTNYKFAELKWYRVVGEYDRRNVVQGEDQFEFEFDDPEDEQDIELGSMSMKDSWIITDTPEDTARYYVTISDFVCPSVASDLTQVNVILKIPTAFTPYVIDGYNDIFMERHALTIFDRYGQKVFEGDNGWNGTKGGKLADPGVYFYVVTMTDGSQRKGTIEVVYLKD